jgi:hypothetical protein
MKVANGLLESLGCHKLTLQSTDDVRMRSFKLYLRGDPADEEEEAEAEG